MVGEDVVLDNMFRAGSYAVDLPSGSMPVSINSLTIQPQAGDTILLEIPAINTAVPALDLSSAANALTLEAGAMLRNGSGAPSGETILLQGLFTIRDGAHYIHRTARANAYLIDHLARDSTTIHGIFEFDVPGTAGYTVSLTNNIFGDLRFSATASGGGKSYSGSGATDLSIRGHMQVGPGASLTSTLTADILLGGDLTVEGTLNLNPVTTGSTGRKLVLQGAPVHLSGAGTISLGANARGIEQGAHSSVILDREIQLPFAAQNWWLHAGATLDVGTAVIRGAGNFHSEAGATLRIGDPNGITTIDAGNIRTATRQLDSGMTYVYTSAVEQFTGDALPSSMAGLFVDKPAGQLIISRPIGVDQLGLLHGSILTTDTTMVTILGTIVSLPDAYGRTDEGWEGSHINGPCRVRTSGPGAWRVPLGNLTSFAPILLQRNGTDDVSYTCSYHSGTPASIIGKGALPFIDDREYWSVSASGDSTGKKALVALSWRRKDWPLIDSLGLQVLHIAGEDTALGDPAWIRRDQFPQVVDLGGQGWVQADLATAMNGYLTLGAIMPMNLLAHTGELRCQPEQEGNALRWSGVLPASDEMHLEFSPDGKNFESITGTFNLDSAFMDKRPVRGDSWYRLAFLSRSGTQLYSQTCRVHREISLLSSLYPQPAWGQINLRVPAILHRVRYQLLDLSGTLVQAGSLPDGNEWRIAIDRPAAGIRVLRLMHADGSFSRMIIIGQRT